MGADGERTWFVRAAGFSEFVASELCCYWKAAACKGLIGESELTWKCSRQKKKEKKKGEKKKKEKEREEMRGREKKKEKK